MNDHAIAQFVSFTSSSPARADQYLRLTDGDVQQAIDLFFANDGNDAFGSSEPAHQSSPPQSTPQQAQPSTARHGYEDRDGVVHIDSDSEYSGNELPPNRESRTAIPSVRSSPNAHVPVRSAAPHVPGSNDLDQDEAMARRLQEEFYGSAIATNELGSDGIRAPMGRTTETLVGPSSSETLSPEEIRAALVDQMQARQRRRSRERPGIFNQATTSSIWNHGDDDTSSDRERLARATAGASETSPKSNMLAEMFRPPVGIISRLSWDQARQHGRGIEKWILVNIQDPAVFDCQVLNRDVWKNAGVIDTVKEHFIFLQYNKNDPRGTQYLQYYFSDYDNQDAYPHIAVIDPRTGEQVKVWSGSPSPKAMDFLMQLHEFLDRYSLKASAKNPVARRKPEDKKEAQIEKMTEEQMLEMALQNSLAGSEASRAVDPDDLTRSIENISEDKMTISKDMETRDGEVKQTNGRLDQKPASTFSSVSASHPHAEPSPDPATTTRIQFRHPSGRVVRRFLLSDPVRRIYEWLKASPLEGKEGIEFELISMQKNLIGALDENIEQAGLKNGTVMVEFLE